MRSWKAVTLTSATKAYWILGAMTATIVTARFLGPHGRGVIAAATSWVALFVTFGHLSLSHVIVYVLAPRDRAESFPAVAGSVLAITAATAMLGWTVAAIMHLATGGEVFQHIPLPALIIVFAGLPLLLWMENGSSLLIVLGDLKRLNLAQIAGTTTGIVLVTVAVGVFKGGVTAAVTASFIALVVAFAIGFARVYREARPLRYSRAVAGELLHGSARLHPGAFAPVLCTHAGVVLLNHFRPVAEAGFFQLAVQLTTATQVVPMAIAIVAYSIVARDGVNAAWPEHRKLILQTVLYGFVATVGSYMVAPIIIPLIAGRAFVEAVPVFRILALSIGGMSLGAVIAPQWVARGYLGRAAALGLAPALLSVAANYVLIPKYGMYAAAWTMVAAYSVPLLVNLGFVLWIETHIERLQE